MVNISVSVRQHTGAYYGIVTFSDSIYDKYYDHVSPSSMRRLATAINNSNMRLELDEYGVPTWTRNLEGVDCG